MAGVRKTPVRGGKFQGYYKDSNGQRKVFNGTRDRGETLAMARKLEDDHRQVALHYRPAQSSSDKAKSRPIADVVAEYIAWGKAQGGKEGRPWAEEHVTKREDYL